MLAGACKSPLTPLGTHGGGYSSRILRAADTPFLLIS